VCLPPEQLTLAGFAQNGEADTMAPGPVLAAVVDAVTGPDGKGLAGCSDDQLMGVISAARRMESRNAWTVMAAMREYAARHAGRRPADEFAPVELGYELHLTPQSAAEQMEFATMVAARLPLVFAALAAGKIHPVHLRILADETKFLSDEDAAKADAALAGAAAGMTFGELRYAAHKLILKLDPEAARKRKEAANHAHAETGYHPSRKLQHLIRARSATCTAPGCTRPAAACDLDHTVPWDQGGLTCECGLAPLCRRHHRAKQAEGWHLDQPEPGLLLWRVPSGRTYATTPTEYPV